MRSFSLRHLVTLPYVVLLLSGLIIPSDGNHGFLSLKGVAFLSSFLSLSSYVWIHRAVKKIELKGLLFMVCGLMFLLFSGGVSLYKEATVFSSLFDQFKLFWLTLSVVGFTLFVIERGLLSYENFLKIILYGNFFYSCCKLLLVTGYLLGFIKLSVFLDFLGIRYMSMTIYQEVSRLQTSMDVITPFLFLFVLQSKTLKVRLTQRFKWLYCTISVLSVLLSFSRFLMAVMLLAFLLHWTTLRFVSLVKWIVAVSLLLTLFVFGVGVEAVLSAVEARFFSHANTQSDQTRSDQIKALTHEFQEHPVVGKGLGSYAEKIKRDSLNLHVYEVQWVAFLMQFGVMGLGMLSLPLVYVSTLFFYPPFSRSKFCFFLLFLAWLLSGFTNPYLLSLTSGMIYSLFILTGKRLKWKNEKKLMSQKNLLSTENITQVLEAVEGKI